MSACDEIHGKAIHTIQILSNGGLEQLRDFERSLRQSSDLAVLLSGGSSAKGALVVVSTEKPTDLVSVLNGLSGVESARKADGLFTVRLRQVSVV